jgi:hypothetical protein
MKRVVVISPGIAIARALAFACCFCGLSGCAAGEALTAADHAQGWQLLFDGHTLKGWHSFGGAGVGKGWSVADGAIQIEHDVQAPASDFADLVSDGAYGNFDLKLEWKMTPCADSGVMFWVQDSLKYRAAYETGPEMQIADRACTKPDSTTPGERSGDLFDLVSSELESVNESGQWNAIEIVVDRGHLQCFQNGHKTVDITVGTPEWTTRVAKTKFAKLPDFARFHNGHLTLQGAEPKGTPPIRIWFRKIRIKDLGG